MMESLLLADLVSDLPPAVRLQRLVSSLRTHFGCGAVALLKLEEDSLRPLAVDGLVRETLGRRFVVGQHPRLATILSRRDITAFDHDSTLPDPYDGLLDTRVGEPLPVHDCMGTSLHVEGQTWGALTFDALQTGTFTEAARDDLRRLTLLVEAAVRVTRLEQDLHALRLSRGGERADAQGASADEAEIVGHSEVIQRLLHEMQVVADSELSVLLLGETGVGKELFARHLHRHSRRAAQPLVHVNCAALPESLAESELFGHVKGAFSGATADRPGRFEAADGGTLFLDEVGELPLTVQAKLLRALQNGEIQRLGADQPRRVDVRVIAATNRPVRTNARTTSTSRASSARTSTASGPGPSPRHARNESAIAKRAPASRTRERTRSCARSVGPPGVQQPGTPAAAQKLSRARSCSPSRVVRIPTRKLAACQPASPLWERIC